MYRSGDSHLSRILAIVGLLFACERTPSACPVDPITAGGQPTERRFFAAPMARVREAVSDSMQALGVALFESSDRTLRGERRSPVIRDMKLPSGNEAVAAYLEPAYNGGIEGTLLRVETRRSGGKKGDPKRSWSATVIEETECLLGLLSVVDPVRDHVNRVQRAQGSPAREVVLPGETPVLLRMRRFLHARRIILGQTVTLEVANDILIGGDIVIPRGALATAKFSAVNDIGKAGEPSKAVLEFEAVDSVSGTKIPIHAKQSFQGGRIEAKRIFWAALWWDPINGVQMEGKGFAIRAGTPFAVVTEGEHRIPIYYAPGTVDRKR